MRELLAVWEAIKDLRRRVTQRPDPIIAPRPPYTTVEIVGGNTLDDGQAGVKYEESPGVETVPSAYDPDVTASFVDGIGRGTLRINQVAQDGYVLVVNDDRGSFRNALRVGDVVWVGDPAMIPVDAGGYVRVYPVG